MIFFGTSETAVSFLKTLLENGFNIQAVVTQPDRPQGRKNKLFFSPVKKLALEKGIQVVQPGKLTLNHIKKYNLDLGIVVDYGQIISAKIINSFEYGILNVHFSLLPKYRGAAPVQYALLNGDKKTGVTIMKLDKGLDTGLIVAQEPFAIDDNDNNVTLLTKLTNFGVGLLINNIKPYLEGKINLKQQDDSQASYCKIIERKDGEIKLTDDAEIIMNKIRAFTPWPGVFFMHKEKRYKIISAHVQDNKLAIDEIQPEGKKKMSWDEFKRGYGDSLPDLFSGIES